MQSNARQCKAMQNNAKQCKAMQSNAKQCKAMQSKAMQSNAKQCKAMQSNAKQSKALQSNAKQSKAMLSKAMQSKANHSNAKQSNAKQSKATHVLTTKHAKGILLATNIAKAFLGIWGFEARNQAREAPKEPGRGGFLEEPGPAPPRHSPPIALENSKNPL